MRVTTLEDLVGIEHCKLGFYQELQRKVEQLKTTNMELERKRKEIQAVLDGITDLMLVLSEDLKIQRVNHVFSEWFPGINPIGKKCYEVLKNNNKRCDNCPAIKSLNLHKIVKDSAIYKLNDKFRHFEIIASPLKTSFKSERNLLLFKRDVTVEKEYKAQFFQAEKMATLGALAAGVAHEINNPLTAISGFAEGLQRRIKNIDKHINNDILEDFKEYTHTIIKECCRCHDIVKTLLTFSRPISSTFGPVDLNKCVKDTLFILKHHFKGRNIEIKINLESDLPVIMGDESQLKQVIINLFTNAIDAILENGLICIKTESNRNEGINLTVEDTGCGIPIDLYDKLFEPFFTTKQVGKGIGIGLSTCYSIVNNHGGDISVNSIEGKGTSFNVYLPGVI